MSIETESGKGRIWVIDVARFYAMALVFYGHFIERFMLLKNPAGAIQYKFIYSFHMVVFFVLAGYVVKETDIEFSFGKYLKDRLISRLLPFVFFTAIFMVLPVFFPGEFYGMKLPSVDGYIKGLLNTLFGIPAFCVPSWFILMLFSVELLHYGAFRFLRSNSKILFGAVIFYVVGYWLNLKLDIFNPLKGRVIGWNYLFIHEAITMYAFYLMGIYLRRRKFLIEKVSLKILVPGAIIMFLIVLFTFKLNTGPFNFNYYDAVVIIFASHGNFFWFPVSAVAGSFLILFLAKITPSQKTIVWMGQNTLILMCLNGIFYHYINARVAKWVLDTLSGSGLTVFWVGCLVTVLSLAVCIPFIYLLNKFVPQLVGKPKLSGPWFKNFI
ncbi:MAG: acyltransferase family protein [Deltaproteobacteria bacterium]|nr:acyltransferase family protein [Deltaproteobacteria bacterium]